MSEWSVFAEIAVPEIPGLNADTPDHDNDVWLDRIDALGAFLQQFHASASAGMGVASVQAWGEARNLLEAQAKVVDGLREGVVHCRLGSPGELLEVHARTWEAFQRWLQQPTAQQRA